MADIPVRVINKPAAQQDDPDAAPVYERMPGPKEIATLEVKGQFFSNWTTVHVEQKWTEAFPTFTFDCTEDVPIPLTVNGAQFVPGDVVRVLLGGAPAVFGYISERHVGFDGQQHGVRLIGCGDTSDLVNSSIPLDKLTGHDGKSVEQLAKDLSAHLNIGIHTRGDVDSTPFDNIQPLPGETPMQCIERYAKMRNIVIGSEANGGLLLIGEHPATTLGWLVEGINIKRANCVVRDPMIYHQIFATGAERRQRHGERRPDRTSRWRRSMAHRRATASWSWWPMWPTSSTASRSAPRWRRCSPRAARSRRRSRCRAGSRTPTHRTTSGARANTTPSPRRR